MENDKKQGTDNERRIEHMASLIEKQVRTERHLEQHSDIAHSPENIEHARQLQRDRQSEIDLLKNKIINGENFSNNYRQNTEKRFLFTEGYLNHNADHMDKEAFRNAKAKQERRKEQLDAFR